MKNVTLSGGGNTPLGGGTSPGGPGMPPRRPARGKALLPLVLGVIVTISAFNVFAHRENRYEQLATDVTRAIAANDMRPVEKDFNAIRRPKREDRAKVGGLSDFVNAEGKLKNVKEQTPPDAKSGTHRFVATFEKGQRAEDLTVDADGKVVDFHVTPLEAK